MKTTQFFFFLLFVLSIASCNKIDSTVGAIPNAPVIISFWPVIGKTGDGVNIVGTNFSTFPSNNTVKFNGVTASVINSSDTALCVIVPQGAITGKISITIENQIAVSSDDYTVLPVINSTVSTFAGSASPGNKDGAVLTAQFNHPDGIAKDAEGNLYIADNYNRSIRKITTNGIVSTVATISNPASIITGLAVDNAGNIYVGDNNLNLIFKITATGTVNVLAGNGPSGYVDGTGTAARFDSPLDVAVDIGGNVYVADAGNNRIRKINPQGVVTTFGGGDAIFTSPRGITIDALGNLYVAELSKVRKITPAGVVTTVSGSDIGISTDGFTSSSTFYLPKGITVDAAGSIFVCENTRIRKIGGGFVNTVAGDGSYGFADGYGLTAKFNSAFGIVVDKAGNLFVADNGNNRIRKITF